MHRVVKEAGSSANYLVLTKTNYNEWSLLMKINSTSTRAATSNSMKTGWLWTPSAAPSPPR